MSASLVRLLAASDALWCPFRWKPTTRNTAGAAVWERRTAYPLAGVPWSVGGSVAQRKSGERELKAMRAAGWIRLHGGKQRTGVSLTAHGDDVARSLVGAALAWEAFPTLAMVADLEERFGNGAPETFVVGKGDWGEVATSELVGLEYRLLPLLHRGWLTSDSDIGSRVAYHVTAAGRAAEPLAEPPGMPAFDGELADVYGELLLEGLEERESWEASKPAMTAIPKSCGLWTPYAEFVKHREARRD
ncbi:hypothetical protein [Botrimarina sp.]|uniref:hypothetical protein n=1 Tax=Botrimarina sp. TaxID=2795802 RepID=UPI0032F06737